MLPLLWEPTGVCFVAFKSIWQSASVSFPAPCHRLSEVGSLSCLRSVWAHSPHTAASTVELRLNSMWHWGVFSIMALQHYPDRFHSCTTATKLSQQPLQKNFSQTLNFSPFFLRKKDASTGFCFSNCFLHLPTTSSVSSVSAKTHWAISCLLFLGHTERFSRSWLRAFEYHPPLPPLSAPHSNFCFGS